MTGEIDRLYLGAPSETYIIDGDRAIRLLEMGFADAVVWNIGETKGAEMKVAWLLTYCDLLRGSYTYYSLTARFLHVL